MGKRGNKPGGLERSVFSSVAEPIRRLVQLETTGRFSGGFEGGGLGNTQRGGWRGLVAEKLAGALEANDSLNERDSLLSLMQSHLAAEKRVDSDLVLHLAFVHARFGLLDEAFSVLERFSWVVPHSENAVLMGYAGLLALVLWEKQTERLRASATEGGFYSFSMSQTTLDESDEENLNSTHFVNAMRFFKASIELPGGYENDMFISCFVKLLILKGELTQARDVLQTFMLKAPLNPNSCRYLLEFYHMHPSDTINFPILASKMLQLDPVCEPELALIPLVEHLEENATADQDHVDILAILSKRLDHDASAPFWVWNKLVHHIQVLRSAQIPPLDEETTLDAPIWLDRRYWWREFHISGSPPIPDAQLVATTDTDRAVAKIIALYLATGSSPSYERLFPSFTASPSLLLPQITNPAASPHLVTLQRTLSRETLFAKSTPLAESLLLASTTTKKTTRTRFGRGLTRIPKGFTREESESLMDGLYGFGSDNVTSADDSESSDEGDDGHELLEETGTVTGSEEAPPPSPTVGRNDAGKRKVEERIRGSSAAMKRRRFVSAEIIERSDEEEDSEIDDGGETMETEKVRVPAVRRLWFENVELSDDEETNQASAGQSQEEDASCRFVLGHNLLPYDELEDVARRGALEGKELLRLEAIVRDGENGEHDDNNNDDDDDDDDDGFNLDAELIKAEQVADDGDRF